MWRLRSCPRCYGDLMISKDRDIKHEVSLQCGYRRELINGIEVKIQQATIISELIENTHER